MEHDIKFSNDKEAVANATLDFEIKTGGVCPSAPRREKRTKETQVKAYMLPPSP
jgi:hypothetical protein